jgi:hypothetical protein
MPGSNQQPPIQSHRILNVTFTGSHTRLQQQQQQQQQTLPGLRYRTTNNLLFFILDYLFLLKIKNLI